MVGDWCDILVVRSRGWNFSFKKLGEGRGGRRSLRACTIIFCMILVGIFCGVVFRVATHGLSVFGRYVGHVLHDYYL